MKMCRIEIEIPSKGYSLVKGEKKKDVTESPPWSQRNGEEVYHCPTPWGVRGSLPWAIETSEFEVCIYHTHFQESPSQHEAGDAPGGPCRKKSKTSVEWPFHNAGHLESCDFHKWWGRAEKLLNIQKNHKEESAVTTNRRISNILKLQIMRLNITFKAIEGLKERIEIKERIRYSTF